MREIAYLNLSNNRLTSIPENVSRLNRLRQRDLSGNQLTRLPNTIADLSNIALLDLSRNTLRTLPSSLSQLSQLQVLDLSKNQLVEIPTDLSELKDLRQLFLHDNWIPELPKEMLGESREESLLKVSQVNYVAPKDVLAYYLRARRDGRALNEAKLVLVGRGGVGKTSIVEQLIYNKFSAGAASTDGIEISQWTLRLRKDEAVRLNIWDFGGQEIMHATHQFFLTQRTVYLVVLSGREGSPDSDAEYWLKLIESFAADSPVIVVMNKMKEYPFDVNRNGLRRKYLAIREFVRTDCQAYSGLAELRKAIEGETDRLEHLRDPFPASWFAIKNQLSGMEENYLSFDEYRSLCATLGETEKNAQEALAHALHNLGVVLNY